LRPRKFLMTCFSSPVLFGINVMKFSKMSVAAILVLEIFPTNFTRHWNCSSMHRYIVPVAVRAGVESATTNIARINRVARTINIQSCNRHHIKQFMAITNYARLDRNSFSSSPCLNSRCLFILELSVTLLLQIRQR